MKRLKLNSKESQEFFEAAEAAQLKEQKEHMGEILKEISRQLQELRDNHPEEYWEAVVAMDPVPTLIPRRPSPQKEWRDKITKKGILLKGKPGSFFDPDTKLNKDVVAAWEGVKQLQYQMKDSDRPWAVELRDLPLLGEETVAQWTPWIELMLFTLNNQQPEKNAHAAENIYNRKKRGIGRRKDRKDRKDRKGVEDNPTKADVRNELLRDLRTPEKGALMILAKDLDRVRGVAY